MWIANNFTYDDIAIFGLKINFDLCAEIEKNNSELSKKDGCFAVLSIIKNNTEREKINSTDSPFDKNTVDKIFVEHFGSEMIFASVTIGQVLLYVFRTSAIIDGFEESFTEYVRESIQTFYDALDEQINFPFCLSLSAPFSKFEDCKQVASETLVAIDFINFVEMPTKIITPEYCKNVKLILENTNPNFRLINYEKPIISSTMKGNYLQAEKIIDNLVMAFLVDPMPVFNNLFPTICGILRTCTALTVLDPRTLTDTDIRFPKLQQKILTCSKLSELRRLLHQYLFLLEDYYHKNKDRVVQSNRMKSIIKYIRENMSNPLFGAPMVCKALNLSTTYFSHIFKDEMGINFSVFLQTLRLTKAKELLLNETLSLDDIALQVGYSNSQNLIRLFKRYEGMSPTAYRQAINEELSKN